MADNDAKKIADGFSFFDPDDFLNLDVGEAIVRVARSDFDFNLKTVPCEKKSLASEKISRIIQESRKKYNTNKELVEAGINETLEDSKYPAHQPVLKPANNKEATLSKNDDTEAGNLLPKVPIKEAAIIAEELQQDQISRHRGLQLLIKKVAEAKNYRATIEALTPDGKGRVDVLLQKGEEIIAIEVSSTTDAEWEIKNIQKCLEAGYPTIISIQSNAKNISPMHKKVKEVLSEEEQKKVKILTREDFIGYLDRPNETVVQPEHIYKGFKVNVEYDEALEGEIKTKEETIKKFIINSRKKSER